MAVTTIHLLFRYKMTGGVANGGVDSDQSANTITIDVTAVDDSAVISGDISYSGNEGDVVSGTMDATDVDGLTDSTYFTVSNPATNGTEAIDPATGAWTYTPTDPNWFGTDNFEVTITDDLGGTTLQLVSITLVNINDNPVGLPTISGIITEGNTLTANTSGISDVDGLGAFSYQWLRNGIAISGATASAYTLGNADVGTLISVQVLYTDAQSTAESITSTQTAAVTQAKTAQLEISLEDTNLFYGVEDTHERSSEEPDPDADIPENFSEEPENPSEETLETDTKETEQEAILADIPAPEAVLSQADANIETQGDAFDPGQLKKNNR